MKYMIVKYICTVFMCLELRGYLKILHRNHKNFIVVKKSLNGYKKIVTFRF